MSFDRFSTEFLYHKCFKDIFLLNYMNIGGVPYRTIWISKQDNSIVRIIDQRFLPYKFIIQDLKTVDDIVRAIKEMQIRGAGLIGVTAGYGMYLATINSKKENNPDIYIKEAAEKLKATRPTAINLSYAIERQMGEIENEKNPQEKVKIALKVAEDIANEDIENCRRIGLHGLKIIKRLNKKKRGEVINILTHCNAGWLAFVDYGSALAPIYAAFDGGIKVHVWVDETRPRNQGARLTAWELEQHGVPYTVIPDNTGGCLMQRGEVDLVIVGADRVTKRGDVINKIGTYLKALAAYDNHVPFYVALPSTTFDWNIEDVSKIPIEERDSEEVNYIEGLCDNVIKKVLLTPKNSPAKNYGFDITPAKLVTGLITERGTCKALQKKIQELFPEKFHN